MVSRACDPNDGDAGWSQLSAQRRPKVGQGMLIPLQPQRASREVGLLTPKATFTRCSYEPLHLTEMHSVEEGLVKARAVLLKGFDEAFEQLPTLLLSQVEDISQGVHNRVHTA
jgi:hypothetical protein